MLSHLEQQKNQYDHGYDFGYNSGYNSGFNQGFDAGYQEGYASGYEVENRLHHLAANASWPENPPLAAVIDTHEELVASSIPEGYVLPHYSCNDLIIRGLDAVKDDLVPLLATKDVGTRIDVACQHQVPFSLVRLGDGEAFVLAQDSVIASSQIKQIAPWLVHAGVDVPDYKALDQLRTAVLNASIVGVTTSRHPHYQPMLFAAFKALDINWRKLVLTTASINYTLHIEGYLQSMLLHRRLLLIGNRAEALQPVLGAAGLYVAGVIAPVNGLASVDSVIQEAAGYNFDVALVPAGIAAVVIAQRLATELGKVAIDFGHLADELIQGNKQWHTPTSISRHKDHTDHLSELPD